MARRPVMPSEYGTLGSQLVRLHRWVVVTDWAKGAYDQPVDVVRLEAQEDNDDDGSYWVNQRLRAYDNLGHEIGPNFRLPYWERHWHYYYKDSLAIEAITNTERIELANGEFSDLMYEVAARMPRAEQRHEDFSTSVRPVSPHALVFRLCIYDEEVDEPSNRESLKWNG